MKKPQQDEYDIARLLLAAAIVMPLVIVLWRWALG